MIQTIIAWFSATNAIPLVGTVPHYAWFALAAFLAIEDVLPRLQRIKGNSIIQCLVNVLVSAMPFLTKVPLVQIVTKLASPGVILPINPDPPKGTSEINMAWLPFLLVAGLALAGCNNAVTAAQKSLTVAEQTISASTKALEQYDYQAQEGIVAKAASPDAAKQQIATYRASRTVVIKAIADAQACALVGQSLIPLVQSGAKKSTDLTVWVAQLAGVAAQLVAALSTLGVSLPAGL